MPETKEFLTGEYSRKIDERFRLTLPTEFDKAFKPESGKCVIAKESLGCLSLWDEEVWKSNLDKRIGMVMERWKMGDLGRNTPDVQRFGRMLSTRHKEIKIDSKARLLLPEGFREFLAVEEGKDVMVVGAGVCLELWQPAKWSKYIEGDISQFGTLLETLSH
jgi:MraZ protein